MTLYRTGGQSQSQVLLTYKVIGGQAPSCMDKLRPPDHCIRPLYSKSAGLLLVPLNVERVSEALAVTPSSPLWK